MRVRKDGSVRAVLTLSPQAGSGGRRVPLTPDDLHWGVRALSVELRTLLYAKLDESRPHVPANVQEASEDGLEDDESEE